MEEATFSFSFEMIRSSRVESLENGKQKMKQQNSTTQLTKEHEL